MGCLGERLQGEAFKIHSATNNGRPCPLCIFKELGADDDDKRGKVKEITKRRRDAKALRERMAGGDARATIF